MAERKAFPLRVDPDLWSAVERCATVNLRSANAEVECLLREALKARGIKLSPPKAVRRGRPSKENDDG